jgi:hypothetical protein
VTNAVSYYKPYVANTCYADGYLVVTINFSWYGEVAVCHVTFNVVYSLDPCKTLSSATILQRPNSQSIV